MSTHNSAPPDEALWDDILELLDAVECHFGNMILEGGLSDEDDEYKIWMQVQEVLELHHPGWKGRNRGGEIVNETFDKIHQCYACQRPSFHDICLPCVSARASAAVKKRCSCSKQFRREEERTTGYRRWVVCLRCLGTVRQLA